MRFYLLASILAATVASGAAAQTVDRYGGGGAYPQTATGPSVAAPPARVLSWAGKTIPQPAPPQVNGYGYPRYVQARPTYGAQLQPAPYAQDRGAPPAPYQVERRATMYPQPQQQRQAYAPPAGYAYAAPQAYAPPQQQQPYPPQQAYAPVPQPAQPAQPQQAQGQPMSPEAMAARMGPPQASYPSPYQTQPYYAPAPNAPAPTPGSSATAPTGVYPTNTVPPQLAYPQAVSPQQAQPMVTVPVGQANLPPAAPPSAQGSSSPQSDPTDPRQPQRVAMNTASPPNQGARLYSLHRDFGLQPDPTPAPSVDEGQTVQLVSSIDSGASDASLDEPSPTNPKPKTAAAAANAAALRGGYPNDPQN